MPAIELLGVFRIYESPAGAVHAVRPCSLRVDVGDYVAITGPSGSGKSTLLNILGLLDGISGGSYRLAGYEVAELTDSQRTVLRGRKLGFVFQAFHLLPYRSVLENVELAMVYSGVRPGQRRSRAGEMVERVGLSHRSDALPPTLSGGERQRVAIARSIVGGPQVLLCDEPTGSLDSGNSKAVMELLGDLNADGLTLIVVTHDADVAARARRQVRIEDGLLWEEAGGETLR